MIRLWTAAVVCALMAVRLPAQTDYYNTDAGRPVLMEDAYALERRGFELQVRVPTEKCGGQWLTLRLPARIPAEQRIGGVAWFDDFQMKAD